MFKFRFEVLLKVRRIKSELAQQALASAQRELNNLISQQDQCVMQLGQGGQDILGMFTHEVRSTDLELFYNHRRALMERLQKLQGAIVKATAEVEEKRDELMKAMKDFKAMERLKEIKQKEYNVEQLRLESKMIDEMAITRHKVNP